MTFYQERKLRENTKYDVYSISFRKFPSRHLSRAYFTYSLTDAYRYLCRSYSSVVRGNKIFYNALHTLVYKNKNKTIHIV